MSAPDLSCYGGAATPQRPLQPESSICLQIRGNAKLALDRDASDAASLLVGYDALGVRTQCADKNDIIDERQVVLGLDFGTSSVKVVIGDAALGKAFAVPFRDVPDSARYLLPTRLHQSSGEFSIVAGSETHRDLKLSLIANPNDTILRERVAAFLAFVIRHVRGWLFSEHSEIYQRTTIFWKLAIGLPVAHHMNDELYRTFLSVAETSWLTSLQPSVDVRTVAFAEKRQTELQDDRELASPDEDVEISVVPEIAAQIYGFVNSSRFNRRDPNIYLMVDVGAGSVDSSLFHVKPSRGRWDFEFFTSVVEPYGVMNLHRHRVHWWAEQLSAHPNGKHLAAALAGAMYATDRTSPLPESFAHYFNGVSVKVNNAKDDPDNNFFRYKVVQQVRGQSYWRAWKDELLSQAQLAGVPAFYCGGGMRMSYYARLQSEMQSMPGCTWLQAQPRRIELPKNLEAPGLKRADYDRLTVAYGLSFLEVGKITRSLPAPKLASGPQASWRSNYVDKDCC